MAISSAFIEEYEFTATPDILPTRMAVLTDQPTSLETDAGYKWRLAGFLFFASALNYGDRTAITALFPLLRKEFDLSDLGLAGIGSAFLWSYAVCSPVAGVLADRISRAKLVVFSLMAWSLVTGMTGLVHSPRAL